MMARFVGHEPCPRCQAEGRDRSGDNLGMWADGGGTCFSCGHKVYPKHFVRKEIENVPKNTEVLPRDFTRDIPALAWRWLLQYGLPYSYWKPLTGYSPADSRLVITVGTPIRFSQGRYIGNPTGDSPSGAGETASTGRGFHQSNGGGKEGGGSGYSPRKWYFYGDRHGFAEILGKEKEGPVVLVEDLVSGHKVAQVAPSLCLFGTNVHDEAVKELKAFKRPVTLWLDGDQRLLLPRKINRLQTLLDVPVGYVFTEKDPKEYPLDEIKEIL